MPKSKRSKATEFDAKTRQLIRQRDGKCIFCKMGKYGKSECDWIIDIMHYVPRSAGGLGIKENGALGCRWHHSLMDNGNKGIRLEMLEDMEAYLKSWYPEWNKDNLIYRKEY